MKITFKDFGDALKDTTEVKATVTHKKFYKYNKYFNKIILNTKNKVEAVVILKDKQEIYYFVSDSNLSVSVPTRLIKGNIIIHNHPSGMSFSKEDIANGIECNSKKLIVFHPDTYIYEAEFQNLTIERFEKLYAIIELKVDTYLIDAISKGVNSSVASFEKQHYIFSEFARREYGFNYKRYKY